MSNVQRLVAALFILTLLTTFGCESAPKGFDKAATANTEQAYRDFIKAHRNHSLAAEAKKRLESIVFESTIKSNDETVLESFLTEFPDSPHFKQVKGELRKLLWPKLPSKFGSSDDIAITVKSLAFDAIKSDAAELRWGDMTVKPEDGKAMDLTPTRDDEGKLLGYKFDVNQLLSLKTGDRIAIYDSEGMHTVTIATPLKGEVLTIEDVRVELTGPDGKKTTVMVNELRLIDLEEGKAGLVWKIN